MMIVGIEWQIGEIGETTVESFQGVCFDFVLSPKFNFDNNGSKTVCHDTVKNIFSKIFRGGSYYIYRDIDVNDRR